MVSLAPALLLLLLLAVAVGLRSPFLLMLGACVVGFLQDPLRKLAPGSPPEISLACGLVLAAALVALFLSRRIQARDLIASIPGMSLALTAYLLVILLQCGRAFLNTGSWIVPVIGALFYLAPLAAVVVVVSSIRKAEDIYRYALVYIAGVIVMGGGLVLNLMGIEHPLLEAVGTGMFATFEEHRLALYSGLFRGSEFAGWHCTNAACLCLVLTRSYHLPKSRKYLLGALVILLLFFVVITGRRKFIVLFCIFFGFHLVSLFQNRASQSGGGSILLISAVLLAGLFGIFTLRPSLASHPNLDRMAHVVEEAPDRLRHVGFENLKWAYLYNGFLGKGAGVGSQGTQHLSLKVGTGAAAEGGLPKILSEIGVPGFLVTLWLGWVVLRHLFGSLSIPQILSLPTTHGVVFGVISLLLANLITFFVGHQIFGDLFVRMHLGFLLGAALTMIMAAKLADRSPRNSRSR